MSARAVRHPERLDGNLVGMILFGEQTERLVHLALAGKGLILVLNLCGDNVVREVQNRKPSSLRTRRAAAKATKGRTVLEKKSRSST